jgi:flagellar operon protein
MIDSINRLPPLPGVIGAEPAVRPVAPTSAPAPEGASFGEELERQLSEGESVRFSAHAQSRLLTRQIQLSGPQMARLQHGVDQAAQKGARDSLVVMDNLAFVVSVSNRTVVTAVDGGTYHGNVFTQIDSAVIV